MDGSFTHSEPASAKAGPIDHEHLRRYTLGNRELEIEVLNLFAGQAPLTLEGLRAATSEHGWHVAAHTLKGSARAVGAWSIAAVAEEAEIAGLASANREALLSQLGQSIVEVSVYIGEFA